MAAVVVIAVFVLAVIGSLYPYVREAPTRQCVQNLKAICTALSLYASDPGDGFMPPAAVWASALGRDQLDDPTVLACPSVKLTVEQKEASRTRQGLPIGYSLFKPLAGLEAARLLLTDKTPAVFDSTEVRPNSTAGLEAMAFRHAGKIGNIVFTDGHAASATAAPPLPNPLFKTPEQVRKQMADEAAKAKADAEGEKAPQGPDAKAAAEAAKHGSK
jgi:prepilin-type processing-associated H-X9-DG protein